MTIWHNGTSLAMERPMIQMRNVSRVYPLKGGPYYALRGINLAIE